jgi:predicted RNase H-like HicB family nuclease
MTFQVLVEHRGRRDFSATVLGWPDCSAQGATRQEALDRIQQAMRERLARSEIVPMEIHSNLDVPDHPWLKYAGMFKDHPLFDEVLGYVEEYRREVDADTTVP